MPLEAKTEAVGALLQALLEFVVNHEPNPTGTIAALRGRASEIIENTPSSEPPESLGASTCGLCHQPISGATCVINESTVVHPACLERRAGAEVGELMTVVNSLLGRIKIEPRRSGYDPQGGSFARL
ncbi:MAG TPA: hypothetical protein VMV27_07340 [Candidatus Binataceae bacterium]|nr:hypothetical protein [Candidatus Binataceae bacterium]